jgi:hypothetical protein
MPARQSANPERPHAIFPFAKALKDIFSNLRHKIEGCFGAVTVEEHE